MRFRPLLPFFVLLCLSLCAAPLAAEPPRSGAMRFSAAASSRLAPRAEDFMDLLCAAEEIEPPPPSSPDKNSARCCDKVSNKPPCEAKESMTLPEFGIVAMQTAEDGSIRASLFARTFVLKGSKPIATRCGRWTYTLRLDPRATQPVSSLTLRPEARAAGTFSGAFPIRARLDFAQVGGGRWKAIPVLVRLGLNGTWTVSAESTVPEAPRESRLFLSIARAESLIIPDVIPDVMPEGAEK